VQNETLDDPVDRQIHNQTLIYCGAAAGGAYCPRLISVSHRITLVFNTGMRNGIELTIEIAPLFYTTQAIFERCVNEVLIPAVTANCSFDGCTNKVATLLCDNSSTHCSENVLRKFARHDVLVITSPPHRLHEFQFLDDLLFGIMKRVATYWRGDETLPKQVDHILQLFRAYKQAQTQHSGLRGIKQPSTMNGGMRRFI
jgi:hypothetical protein